MQSIGCGNFNEGRISYVGCLSHCKFCYARAYSWPERAIRYSGSRPFSSDELFKVFKTLESNAFSWIRITGGEPLLTEDRVTHLVSFLEKLSKYNANPFGSKVVLQTNGVTIGQKNYLVSHLEKLAELDFSFIIELSLKGTNEEECKILTDNRIDFLDQVNGYWILSKLSSGAANMELRARVGIGPSEPAGGLPTYEFVYPSSENYMFTTDLWLAEFREIYETERSKSGNYLAMECLNTPRQGGINIAMVYRSIISDLKKAQIIKQNRSLPSPQYKILMENVIAPFMKMNPSLYLDEFPRRPLNS